MIYLFIITFILLLALSAYFSAAEVALVGINRAKVNALAEKYKKGRYLVKLKERSDHFLITILIGNNVVNIAATALATSISLELFGSAGVAIATVVVTILVLVFGEIGPKTYTNNHQEKVALGVARSIYFLTLVLTPIYWIYDKVKGIGKGDGEKAVPSVTEEEIREWIDVGEMEGAIEVDEKEMIYSVLQFNDTTAREIMTPRPRVTAIEDTCTIEDAVENFRENGYSRVPVYHGIIDNIVGTLNIKDVFNAYSSGKRKNSVKSIMVDVYCVPESKKIDDLLRELQVRRVHMAVVLDEFGGFSGIVTFEDVLEELVGDIMDETDDDEVSDVIEIGKGIYMVAAQTRVAMLNQDYNLTLPEDSGNYETIGGLVFSYLGHIPRMGESIVVCENDACGPVTLSVTKMRGHQVLKVKMMLPGCEESADEKKNSEKSV